MISKMKYMLDTNICIYIIKKKPRKVFDIFKSLEVGDICISSVTLAELQYGVYKSQFVEKNKIALTAFLAPITILPFSDKAAVVYGNIQAELEKMGQPIGAYDLMIAAHALSERLVLASNNMKDFDRIQGLRVTNWV